MPETKKILLAAVGNTRARLAWWEGGEVVEPCSIERTDFRDLPEPARRLASEAGVGVLAGVHRDGVERLETALRGLSPALEVLRIGRDVPIRLTHALDDASTVGQDRLLNALAAYDRAEQACVVIDVGTAVTIDFMDGQGTFQGGIIAPGVRMMLDALARSTDALPEIVYERPDPARGPFGRDTQHAMRLGVTDAVMGAVRSATERFAEAYGAYPQIIATGGDAGLLEETGLVEHLVPDLQLLGIGLCLERADEEG
jgi:type III pantothenate kinase